MNTLKKNIWVMLISLLMVILASCDHKNDTSDSIDSTNTIDTGMNIGTNTDTTKNISSASVSEKKCDIRYIDNKLLADD